MTTESRLIDERNLNNLHHANLGGNHSFRIDNNNDDDNNCIDDSLNSSSSSTSSSGRKPSYVGLSCTVSGYSNFTRYQSPSRKTSPSAIPVSSPPQVLDCNDFVVTRKMRQPNDRDSPPVRGQLDYDVADNSSTPHGRHYFPSTQTRKIVTTDTGETTVETVTRFYGNRSAREESPCSDSSSSVGSLGSGNGNSGSGNLVQKQIERLYGGRVHSVRLTSPEPKSPESDEMSPHETSDQKTSGGFFAKRFGIVKQRDYSSKQRREPEEPPSNEGHPLDVKTLKVPAVFRLLRPEFREQLKLNSCQVRIPLDQSSAPPKKERIIPIVRENDATSDVDLDVSVTPERTLVTSTTTTNERLIPIVVEKQNGESKMSPASLKTASSRTPRSPVKPALPAKPLSPTRPTRSPKPPATSIPITEASHQTPEEEHVITVTIEKLEDPAVPEKVMIEELATPDEVVASNTSASPSQTPSEETSIAHDIEKIEEAAEDERHANEAVHHTRRRLDYEDDEEEDPFQADRYLRSSTSPPCGIRERSLLCPIQEEDTESTASGCSVSVNGRAAAASVSAGASKEPTPLSTTSLDESVSADRSSVVIVDEFVLLPKPEGEHDGHYFIKVSESSRFLGQNLA